jgi:cold shock CspA family protein
LDVDVEAVKRGTVFQTQITLEHYGFTSSDAARLGWRGKHEWIKRLPELGIAYTGKRLLTEAGYFKDHQGPAQAVRFYDGLIKRLLDLPKGTVLLQVGWGTGWESKTLGSSMLRQDDRQFERLLQDYRMTKQRRRQPGDPFPVSRNLAVIGGRPALPMGWVEVRFEGLDRIEMAEPSTAPAEAAPTQRTGRLSRFFPDRGFGFIEPDDGGDDVFVHVSGLADSSATLRQGQRLAFDVEEGEKGLRAVNVVVVS